MDKIQELLTAGYMAKKFIQESSGKGKKLKPQEAARQDGTNQGEDHQTAGKQDARTQGGTKVKGRGE